MSTFLISGNEVYADASKEVITNGFPPSVYTAVYNSQTGQTTLTEFSVNSDNVIDLPKSEYASILKDVKLFFKPETKAKFDQFGYVYKKAILLHGAPGNGKTCIVVRLINEFRQTFSSGVVLFNPALQAISVISGIMQPTTPMLVVFEEFDGICNEFSESYLLSLLDGQIQRPNTFYIFTTNFLNKIPKRLFRPSRISNLLEVNAPSLEARFAYLTTKLPDDNEKELFAWAQTMEGMSLDDLKHSVLCVKCMNMSLEETIEYLKQTHIHLDNYATHDSDDYEDGDDIGTYKLKHALKSIKGYIR